MAPFARLRDVVPSAYLRVFQPLDGFERQEQLHWERYLIEGARATSLRPRYADHRTAGRLGMIAPAEGEHAEIRVIDGRTFVSPWRMHLRVLAALLSFSATKPLELSDQFVTKQDAKRAGKQLARIRRRDPPRGRVRAIRVRGTFRSGGSCCSMTENVGWARTSSVERGCAIERRLGARCVVPSALCRFFAEPTSGPISRADPGPAPVDGGVRSGVAPRARLRDALRLHDVGRVGRRPQSSRDLHEALDALEREEYPRSADIYQGVLTRWAEIRSREIMN